MLLAPEREMIVCKEGIMNNYIRKISAWRPSQSGQTMTEYALILAVVAVVAVATYITLGTTITSTLNKVISCL
jgi:Flp pilus assembly pilin Flp